MIVWSDLYSKVVMHSQVLINNSSYAADRIVNIVNQFNELYILAQVEGIRAGCISAR